jgi:hypothetical protein
VLNQYPTQYSTSAPYFCTVHYGMVPYSMILHCSIQYHTVQYCTLQYCGTVQNTTTGTPGHLNQAWSLRLIPVPYYGSTVRSSVSAQAELKLSRTKEE